MPETDSLIRDMADRLFTELATPAGLARHDAGEWLGTEWQRVAELGFPLALMSETSGGLGIDPVEALGRPAGARARDGRSRRGRQRAPGEASTRLRGPLNRQLSGTLDRMLSPLFLIERRR